MWIAVIYISDSSRVVGLYSPTVLKIVANPPVRNIYPPGGSSDSGRLAAMKVMAAAKQNGC